MRNTLTVLLLLFVCSLSAQEIIDTYNTLTQTNDSTWLIQKFNVYETAQVIHGAEVIRTDTILLPGESAYYDSAGIIRQLLITTTQEQAQISGLISRSFSAVTSARNVVDANILIDEISADSTNYFEETAKFFQNDLVGQYRVLYDSSGVQLSKLADLTLRTTPAHPDGRSLRLTLEDGQFWTVRAHHKWRLQIVGWPFGEEKFSWHRTSSISRPVYRPEDYVSRTDKYTRIVKIQ